jgi:hypothetical protein
MAEEDGMSGKMFMAWVDEALTAKRRLREEEIRRMLGCWVSEVEPEVVLRAHDSRLLGLTAAGERFSDGPVPIHVFSSYVDPADPHDQRASMPDGRRMFCRDAPLDSTIEIDIRP